MKNMNKITAVLLLVISMFLFQGCDVIFGIFEAGLWVGVIISVIFLVLVIWLAVKILKWLSGRR